MDPLFSVIDIKLRIHLPVEPLHLIGVIRIHLMNLIYFLECSIHGIGAIITRLSSYFPDNPRDFTDLLIAAEIEAQEENGTYAILRQMDNHYYVNNMIDVFIGKVLFPRRHFWNPDQLGLWSPDFPL